MIVQQEESRIQRNDIEGDKLAADRAHTATPSAIDVEEFLPEMAEYDLTEEQAIDHLITLAWIMKALVDLGIGVESIHDFVPAMKAVCADLESAEVDSNCVPLIRQFEQSTQMHGDKDKES